MSYKTNNIDFSEIVDVYDIHGHDKEVEVLGYDEAGNEYSACAIESAGELVEVFEDTIELIRKADSNAPTYYTYVMKKKDRFGINVIKPVRTEWLPIGDR